MERWALMNKEAEFPSGVSGDQPGTTARGQGIKGDRNGALDPKESSQGVTSFPRENKNKGGCGGVEDTSGLMDGSNS